MITAVKENTKLKPALAIGTGVPITLAKEATDAPLLSADKTIQKFVKGSIIFTWYFPHRFSFPYFCDKMVFGFVDFI